MGFELAAVNKNVIARKRLVVSEISDWECAENFLLDESVFGIGMKDCDTGVCYPSHIEVSLTKGGVQNFFNIFHQSNIVIELIIFATQNDKDRYLEVRNRHINN